MKRFHVKEYRLTEERLSTGEELRFCVLSDLHGMEYGTENRKLQKAILGLKPDAVLIAGDMQIRKDPGSLAVAEKLLTVLSKDFPVYYGMGNHETAMREAAHTKEQFLAYEEDLQKRGIQFLHNKKEQLEIRGQKLEIFGIELSEEYYRKPFSKELTLEEMDHMLGRPDPSKVSVLLAHNPKYAEVYAAWGADYIVCGHYHGGMLRFNEHVGAISPQLRPFPPYCCGKFEWEGKQIIVSAGLGEHTLPVRIHNPRELVYLRLQGPKEHPYQEREESKENGN